MTTAGGMWGAAGWILFLAAMVGLWVQRTIINKLREELSEERAARELMSNQLGEKIKRIEVQQQRIMKQQTEILEMDKNMKRLLKEEAERDAKDKDRDDEVALLRKTVETNAATIERLSNALDQREMGNDTA